MTNVHLYAFLVPVWIACLAAGAWWDGKTASVQRYSILAVASGVACLMTPMLPGVLRTIAHYQLSDEMVDADFITEMQPFYTGIFGHATLTLAVAFAGLTVRNRARLGAAHWLWLIIGTSLMFQLGRFAPLFALVAAPALVVVLPRLSDRILYRPAVACAVAAILVIGMVRVGAAFPRSDEGFPTWVNRHGPEVPGYPCAAADYVAGHVRPTSGRIINEFTWGGYLGWRFAGQFQVFMDGRTQVFPAKFWRDTYLGTSEDRQHLLASTRADVAILPKRSRRFREQLLGMGWRVAYDDEYALVLLPPEKALSDAQ